MSKIVYLFGAGASANALPVIDGIPARINSVIDKLKELSFESVEYFKNISQASKQECLDSLIADLGWLRDNSAMHATIDTFAKKLYIKHQDKDLVRLKNALSVFFTIEQIKRPDPRYDSFFASLLGSSPHALPKEVAVISWNYDCQFEHTYSEYINSDLSTSQSVLNVGCKYDRDSYSDRVSGFRILKINGSASLTRIDMGGSGGNYYYHESLNHWNKEVAESIIMKYGFIKHLNHLRNLLSFSWEREDDKLMENIAKVGEDTTTVVVIGYSFPYFNREIDRKIFESMPNLKTIYFQDINPQNIISRFQAISSRQIAKVPILDTQQFFLPPEL